MCIKYLYNMRLIAYDVYYKGRSSIILKSYLERQMLIILTSFILNTYSIDGKVPSDRWWYNPI